MNLYDQCCLASSDALEVEEAVAGPHAQGLARIMGTGPMEQTMTYEEAVDHMKATIARTDAQEPGGLLCNMAKEFAALVNEKKWTPYQIAVFAHVAISSVTELKGEMFLFATALHASHMSIEQGVTLQCAGEGAWQVNTGYKASDTDREGVFQMFVEFLQKFASQPAQEVP